MKGGSTSPIGNLETNHLPNLDDRSKKNQAQIEERQQRDRQKQEQATGDSLYWYIYNLDQKNPNTQTDFEHLPPEQLVANIWQKEQRILEILSEIKDVLQTKPVGKEDA